MSNLIIEKALNWIKQGHEVALATVIETWGSAPRQVGAQLIVNSKSEMEGSVSGGCVESAVVYEALDCLKTGKTALLEYGVSQETAFSVGLACGGKIKIYLEPIGITSELHKSKLEKIIKSDSEGRSCAIVTNLITNEQHFIEDERYDLKKKFSIDRKLSDVFLVNDSFVVGDWFVKTYAPPIHLIIIGAVHISQELVKIAKLLGYSCTIIDPRTSFGNSDRFPENNVINEWPDIALEELSITSKTALVTLTHDPKLDDPAIKIGLKSTAFYLGCLGSKKTHKKRLERLIDEGYTLDELRIINAPVGLDIGARNPPEIALSIACEIMVKLRHRIQVEK